MVVKKKASQLRVNDKILGNTNYYIITSVKNSTFTGSTYPVIEVVDAFGNKKTIETGSSEKLQDHIYEVEVM